MEIDNMETTTDKPMEPGREPQPGDLRRMVAGMLWLPEEAIPNEEPAIERCQVDTCLRMGSYRVETHLRVGKVDEE